MMKTIRVIMLISIISLSILAICISLMSVMAQADESSKDFRYWQPERGLFGFFGRGWVQSFNKSIRIGPYCNHFKWRFGPIEVSEEFKENVVKIAEGDPDVQKLLSEGYNITCIRPIVSTIITGDGSVVAKAKSAILILCKNSSGIAFVWVDVENSKVTRVEIVTRTVIEKP
jgi:hypothetical protein